MIGVALAAHEHATGNGSSFGACANAIEIAGSPEVPTSEYAKFA